MVSLQFLYFRKKFCFQGEVWNVEIMASLWNEQRSISLYPLNMCTVPFFSGQCTILASIYRHTPNKNMFNEKCGISACNYIVINPGTYTHVHEAALFYRLQINHTNDGHLDKMIPFKNCNFRYPFVKFQGCIPVRSFKRASTRPKSFSTNEVNDFMNFIVEKMQKSNRIATWWFKAQKT